MRGVRDKKERPEYIALAALRKQTETHLSKCLFSHYQHFSAGATLPFLIKCTTSCRGHMPSVKHTYMTATTALPSPHTDIRREAENRES